MKLSHNQLKYLRSLHQRKFRQKYHNFIVEGAKMAKETLQHNSHEIESIFATEGWILENEDILREHANSIYAIDEAELKKISLLSTPNQVFMIVKKPDESMTQQLLNNQLSLFLEDIQDPGNLGTIWRIADWFGINQVFLSPNCVEAYNPKVIQASMGAFLRVSCIETDFDELIDRYPGIPLMGAVMDGENLFDGIFPKTGLLLVGNESQGLSNQIQSKLTHRITIPKSEKGGAESLNAAVATGIICAFFKNS